MRIHQAVLVLAAGLALFPAKALAQAAACTEDYEKAQEEKANGRLNAALAHMRGCVNPDCPKFIREDCGRWMDQTEAALPSVVFAVRRDGVDQIEVDVTCDGESLVRSLDGKAIPIDPGPHKFSFKIAGLAPIERQLLVREGERNRIVQVEFRSLPEPIPSTAAATTKSTPAAPIGDGGGNRKSLTYGLAGMGALGIAGFAVFAIWGNIQQNDLEQRCAPACQPSDVDSVKTKYLVADTCLGVGLVSLGVAAYLYLSNRGAKSDARPTRNAVSLGVVPRSVGTGGVLQLSTVF